MKNNREIVLTAVKSNGYALRSASDELQADKEVVLAVVKYNGYHLRYASTKLKADKEVVLTAVRSNGMALCHASEELKADKQVALTAVTSNGKAFADVDSKLSSDKDILLAAEKSIGYALLRHVDMVVEVVKADSSQLTNARSHIRGDYSSVKQILRANGYCFQYLSQQFKQKEELLHIAVESNPMVLELLPEEMQENKIVLQAAKQFYGAR